MVSRRNGELKRSVLSALAAMIAAAVPSLIALPAQADPPAGGTPRSEPARLEQAKAGKHDKREGKQDKKGHGAKAQKAREKHDVHADKREPEKKGDAAGTEPKTRQEAGSTSTAKAKKSKKTASRGASTRAKKAPKKGEAEAPPKPCFGREVTVDRGGLESQTLPLVDCHGAPLEAARAELSLLARPWSVARPGDVKGKLDKPAAKGKAKHSTDPNEVAPGIRLIDKGLLARLDAIGKKFHDRPISLVSGYRPQSRGSQHQSARALDLRVAGVNNEELIAFCKKLPDTGCGYYPNSSFVHIDVRAPHTGGVSWIDASGPGEAPRYVQAWPPPDGADDGKAPADVDRHDDSADPWRLDLGSNDADDDPYADLPDEKPAPPASDPPVKGRADASAAKADEKLAAPRSKPAATPERHATRAKIRRPKTP